MQINLTNAGTTIATDVPVGSDLGHVRTLHNQREDLGVPASYTMAVNSQAKEDSYVLMPNDTVSFRPLTGTKG